MSGGELAQTSAWLWICLDLFIVSKWTADLGGNNRDLKQQCSNSASSVSSFLHCKTWQICQHSELVSGRSYLAIVHEMHSFFFASWQNCQQIVCAPTQTWLFLHAANTVLFNSIYTWICTCSEKHHRMKKSPEGGVKSMAHWECQI